MFRSWRTFQTARRVVQPTWFATLLILAVGIALLVPQGRDALAYAAEQGPGSTQSIALLLGVAILAACVWYFSRALLYVEYWNTPSFEPWHLVLRRRYPRALGAAAPLFAALSFALQREWGLVLLYALVAALFLALVIARRRLFSLATLTTHATMPRPTVVALWAVLAGSYVLLAAFLVSRVTLPQALGAIPVFMLAAASWIAFGSLILIYPTYRFRLPSLVVVAVLATGVFSIWNDNHALRVARGAEDRARPALETHFRAWWQHRAPGDLAAPYPVVVIAADGGGIRAAYWTASVLARLEEEQPGFGCHVFAASTVSGASLGAAAYGGLLAELDDSCAPGSRDLLGPARRLLGRDFLAPALGGLLFPDLLQRFLPIGGLPDRAAYLEEAWEAPWRDDPAVAHDWMGGAFAELWSGGRELRLPSLFFNGTWVNDGGRTAVSNLRLDRHHGFLTGLDDLLTRAPAPIPLSTAAHASARFPYISPAGTVNSDPRLYVVDGGYYENSGAITAAQLIRMLHEECRRDDECRSRMRLIALVISNDPGYPGGCASFYDADKNRGSAFTEILAPPLTFWRTRSARGYDAECALQNTIEGLGGRFERISLNDVDEPLSRPAAPLGWMLSESTRRRIDQRADELVVPPTLRFDATP